MIDVLFIVFAFHVIMFSMAPGGALVESSLVSLMLVCTSTSV
jgi:hypothetical protein